MRKPRKENTTLQTNTITINEPTQTPIEITLKIDENEMATASNLYVFFELEPKNFAR